MPVTNAERCKKFRHATRQLGAILKNSVSRKVKISFLPPLTETGYGERIMKSWHIIDSKLNIIYSAEVSHNENVSSGFTSSTSFHYFSMMGGREVGYDTLAMHLTSAVGFSGYTKQICSVVI